MQPNPSNTKFLNYLRAETFMFYFIGGAVAATSKPDAASKYAAIHEPSVSI